MTVQLKGEITAISDVIQVTNNFSKKILTIKTDSETTFPQWIKLETHNIKMTLLDTFKVGEVVNVDVNVNGKEGNVFNSLVVWKINKI